MSIGVRDVPLTNGTDGDRLNVTRYAEALKLFVEGCETPMTIGIQGEWGSGKSSLLQMVGSRLNPDFVSVFKFEAWQHGALGLEDQLGSLLLQQVVNEIAAQQLEKNAAMVRKAIQVKNAIVRSFRPVAAAAINQATGGLADGQTFVDSLMPDSKMGGGIGELKLHFEELVRGLCKDDEKKRCAIFIDDLDRVRPSQAVAMLEVIKNFADVPQVVFVVACDYEVVRESVREKFQIRDEKKVKAFFDKIIQVPFSMPSDGYTIKPLLRDFLSKKSSQTSAKSAEKEFALKWDSSGKLDALADTVQLAIGTNPRAAKRFLNSAELMALVQQAKSASGAAGTDDAWQSTDDVVPLMLLAALQGRWPSLATFVTSRVSFLQLQPADVNRNKEALRRIIASLQLARLVQGSLDDASEEMKELSVAIEGVVAQIVRTSHDEDDATRPSDPRDFQNELESNEEVQQIARFGEKFVKLVEALGDSGIEKFRTWAELLGVTSVGPQASAATGGPAAFISQDLARSAWKTLAQKLVETCRKDTKGYQAFVQGDALIFRKVLNTSDATTGVPVKKYATLVRLTKDQLKLNVTRGFVEANADDDAVRQQLEYLAPLGVSMISKFGFLPAGERVTQLQALIVKTADDTRAKQVEKIVAEHLGDLFPTSTTTQS